MALSGQRLRVRGLVQGVGFRPTVWRIANALGLVGRVWNDAEGVLIELAGARQDEFLARLHQELPPLARIDAIEGEAIAVDADGFSIRDSVGGEVHTAIGPDAAICPACLADMCDPAGRRWRYALTTCTHCGPRYTVSAGIPYDRARTSLAPFPLCDACAAEYGDPGDRRFHAETTGCPDCGPRLRLLDAAGAVLAVDRDTTNDPIQETVRRLHAGQIVAIQGLGGFHLACDARNVASVAELRRRKQREAKPFAVMALNPASLAEWVSLNPEMLAMLRSTAAPIVLAPLHAPAPEGIAPGLAEMGVMLPTMPLHLLLWHEAAGRPAGTEWRSQAHPLCLVMTSANPRGEPLVIEPGEGLQRLAGIADAFLVHDRAILARADDSLWRPGIGLLRRARGYVPLPIPLAEDGPDGLAFGAHLKNTICLARGREAFLSTHIGSLDNTATLDFLEENVGHLRRILAVDPVFVVHDRHPDYASSQLARALAAEWRVPALAVGHHHAHVAAVCAEHGVSGPVLGLAIDGLGLGDDGALWGGELLAVDGAHCERVGSLRPLPLPGGERAAREPWRLALAARYLSRGAAEAARWAEAMLPEQPVAPVLQLLERGVNCPPTSSLGRVFDAAAALLGVCRYSAYEGEAAMRLEALAGQHGPTPAQADGYRLAADGQLDLLPLLDALAGIQYAAFGAALFHATLVDALSAWVAQAIGRTGRRPLVVAGGCAQNRILVEGLTAALAARGLRVWRAEQVPANDGGLALGQIWIARHALAAGAALEPPPGCS